MRNVLRQAAAAVLFLITLSSLRSISALQLPISRPPASVNLSELAAAAPFHDIAAQYDREIATLRYIRTSTAPDARIALEQNRNALLRETAHADARIRAINDPRLPCFIGGQDHSSGPMKCIIIHDSARLNGHGLQESAVNRLRLQDLAISDQIRDNGDLLNNHDVADDVRLRVLKQVSAGDALAGDDSARYHDDLASQERNVLRKYKLLLNSGMRRAYAAQAQMLRERESLLAFRLAQKESGIRLQTHTRLQNLAPDQNERARLRSTLQLLDRQDNAMISEQIEKDAVLLQGKRARLAADARAAYERMREHIEKTDAANLAERRRIADMQRNSAFPKISIDAGETSSLSDKLRDFSASDRTKQNERKTLNAFDHSRTVLTTRFALLSTIDASAKSATNAQIALLIRERLALRNEVAALILRDAQNIADHRNLGKVFPSNQAPRGSIDITAAVKNNLKTSLF